MSGYSCRLRFSSEKGTPMYDMSRRGAPPAPDGAAAPGRRRRPRRPHRALAWALVIATLVICLAAGPRIRERSLKRATAAVSGLVKRYGDDPPVEDHGIGSLLRIPYDEVYEKCPPALKPLFVALLVLILIFLFCTISITASDFFCPNLATVAAYLGLSETTAGVTLLAFGNGSPDVFSTFVAVKQGTFGLAVGELIGAASFITSIVVGSIAMVRPFHVPKLAFLRDVSFFTAAVFLLMLVLRDGKLTIRESGLMVGLYGLYVAAVVTGSWWSARRRRREAFANLGWKAHDDEEAHQDTVEVELPDQSESLTLTPSPHFRRGSLGQGREDDDEDDDRAADTQRAAWSLLGAVEFRDAINALKREGFTPGSSRPNSRPTSPNREFDGEYFGRHHRRASTQGLVRDGSLRRPGRSRSSSLVAGWLGRTRHSTPDLPSESQPLVSPGLETVPGSPSSATTPPRLPPLVIPGHPATDTDTPTLLAENDNSHPLARLTPRLNAIQPPGTAVEDEPLSGTGSTFNIPAIAVVDPEGSFAPLRRVDTQATLADRVNHTFHRVMHTLFPSLQGFTKKSFVGMVLAVLSTPALLVLTVTLPVVDDGRGDEGEIALPGAEDEPLGPTPQGATPLSPVSPRTPISPHTPMSPRDRHIHGEVSEELHHFVDGYRPRHMPDSSAIVRSGASCPADSDDGEGDDECVLDFSPALAATQCILGPVVCTWLLFQDEDYLVWVLLAAFAVGCAGAALVYHLADDGTAQPWRLVRCCAGFVCSMVWIATIADEVVAVLQTFGEIFGLSDAIIGLTIFAVGNSLADLVANVTIAQFAPNMAYSACFGGPMLNLLLGVGGSGSYSILMSPTKAPVTIDFSPTLWVSGTGLLLILAGTAVIVPINSFFIDRRWAICLLIGYAAIMTTNVIVEVRSERRS